MTNANNGMAREEDLVLAHISMVSWQQRRDRRSVLWLVTLPPQEAELDAGDQLAFSSFSPRPCQWNDAVHI